MENNTAATNSTVTYNVVVRDDREIGRLRGISHGYDCDRIPMPNQYGMDVTVHYWAVEERIADLFEQDCDADDAVVEYSVSKDQEVQ